MEEQDREIETGELESITSNVLLCQIAHLVSWWEYNVGLGILGTTKWVNASKIPSTGVDGGSEAAKM